jgi:hypothetical protein
MVPNSTTPSSISVSESDPTPPKRLNFQLDVWPPSQISVVQETFISARSKPPRRPSRAGAPTLKVRKELCSPDDSSGVNSKTFGTVPMSPVLVGARGFEPRTSCAQGRRATRLRYAPT